MGKLYLFYEAAKKSGLIPEAVKQWTKETPEMSPVERQEVLRAWSKGKAFLVLEKTLRKEEELTKVAPEKL